MGITPEKHIENLTTIWKEFCNRLDIKYDSFYKTSDKSHHDKVKIIWNNFVKKGYIYKKPYKGKYCLGCESFKIEKELINGKCFDHPNIDIKDIEEENYFFRLSNYKESLLNWISKTPDFLEPKNKIEELKNLIINSEDISISRIKENCPWGVSVPNDDSQIIYVWFDALLNYIFAAGYLTDNFNWDNVIQICGPDNLRFQAVIFQAFLEAEEIKKSSKLLVHGTIVDKNGIKISKSIGNIIDPIEQIEKYSVDAVRYYSLAGLNTYSTSSWNEEDLKNIWNSDVVNDWGNLLSRVLHLIDIKCNRNIKLDPEVDFINDVELYKKDIENFWNDFKVKDALAKTNELVKFANKYINYKKPWVSDNYDQELSNLKYLLIEVNKLYKPIFVDKFDIISKAIEDGKKQILFNRL